MNMDEVVAAAESLRGADLQRYPIEEVERRLKELITNNYHPLGVGKKDPHIWYRGVPCMSADGFPNLHRCIYPPPERVDDFGRANYPGEPAFYAAWNEITVFNELALQPGEFVHLTASRIQQGSALIWYPRAVVTCHVIGDFQHFCNTGTSMVHERNLQDAYDRRIMTEPKDAFLQQRYLDAFFASAFAVRMVKRGFGHKLTAAFAKMFFSSSNGILYPSVETPGAINLAIPPKLFDDCFEVVWTMVIRVDRVYGHGVYDFSYVRFSHDFSDNGDINWDDKNPLPMTFDFQRGKMPIGHVKGWRVPK